MPARDGDQLDLDVTHHENATVITVRGDISIDRADGFASRLESVRPQARPVIVLDLTEMRFICSRGLGAMVTLEADHRRNGGRVRLASPTRPIRQLLEATRLHQVLPIYEAVDRATIA